MSASSFQALDYLEQLSREIHRKLYKQPSTVLAIFRCMLPHLAKSIVMALLYMPAPFPVTDLDAWFRAESTQKKQTGIRVLERLNIIVEKRNDDGQRFYELYPNFASSLRQALEGSGSHRSFGVPSNKTDKEKITIEFLDKYSQQQWENILFYLVGSTVHFSGHGTKDIGKGTKGLLQMAGFYNHSITREGFTFVLKDTNAQVWSLLIAYLKNAPVISMSETDILNFLFMLGSLELGIGYSTATLSETQLHMLDDLAEMGIVYRSSEDLKTFYPTRLAVTLTSDTDSSATSQIALGGGSTSKGFLIVETNYRIYAYTNSMLQIAILSLFTSMKTRFPNLVSGKLTRGSIGRAIKHGITSAQIIEYLETHAHPQMQKTKPFLPPTVMDQIRLWEYERERMETQPGFLLRDFKEPKPYKELVQYAKDIGVLVWQNDEKLLFFVDSLEMISQKLKRDTQKKGPAGP